MPIRLTSSGPGAFHVELRVVPGAKRDKIVGDYDGALKVAVAKPPEDGAANVAVEKFLRAQLGLPRGGVTLVGGFTSRDKLVRIVGLTREELTERLAKLIGGGGEE
jgi:uncharacterized protein (TIGR00251 family)